MKELLLSDQKHWVKLDDEDYFRFMKCGLNWQYCNGYAKSFKMIKRKRYVIYMHRLIMQCKKDNKLFVDHVNHDTLDNTRINLRIVTRQQQQQNLRGMKNKVGKTSKYKGVSWNAHAKKWIVQCRKKTAGKMYIGLFDDEYTAAKAYDEVAKIEHGDYACLNFTNKTRR